MFTEALDEDVGREASRDFRNVLFPLFYPHEGNGVSDPGNPINAFGSRSDSTGNRNRLRARLDEELPSDHDFHDLMNRLFGSDSSSTVRTRFNTMLRKYRDYAISVRDDGSDSD